MGTEIAVSFTSLRAQLESERSTLYKIDENIKKIVQTSGRYADRFSNQSGDYGRGGQRLGSRNSFPDGGNNQYKNDELFGKRKNETKTVFSRLSARAHESDGEDEGAGIKRSRVSSAVSRELPTRAAVLRAQGGDEQSRTRNRRIFGSLLGTLQKFKQEEIELQTKEDKKAQVEKKIEEQERQQKEKELKERKSLFAEREQKKQTIKALEAKMARVQEFEKWEESQRHLGNFILTKVKPHLYWIPKKMSEKAEEKLTSSRKYHEKCMTKKRQELEEELSRIEQRCNRRGPGAKENHPNSTEGSKNHAHENNDDTSEVHYDDQGKKRDKFAMDVDEAEKNEDSDCEDGTHNGKSDEPTTVKSEEKEENVKMETTNDDSTTSQTQQQVDHITEEQPTEAPLTNAEQPPLPQDEPQMDTEHS